LPTLNQVGMAVAVMRGAAPEACLQAALDPDRDFNVPMAPELGLFLVRSRGRRPVMR
jgi:tRNA U38,U39,U40 pseudouridine synthase TruA